jgi:hypothetical protein
MEDHCRKGKHKKRIRPAQRAGGILTQDPSVRASPCRAELPEASNACTCAAISFKVSGCQPWHGDEQEHQIRQSASFYWGQGRGGKMTGEFMRNRCDVQRDHLPQYHNTHRSTREWRGLSQCELNVILESFTKNCQTTSISIRHYDQRWRATSKILKLTN